MNTITGDWDGKTTSAMADLEDGACVEFYLLAE